MPENESREDYDDAVKDARSMSLKNLIEQIRKLVHLSDDPNENITTGDIQKRHGAYRQVEEEKRGKGEKED